MANSATRTSTRSTWRCSPFYLNLHYQDVAHTLILGATGSGKSFLLNFLLTNAQKYQPMTLIFDLAGGYEHLAEWFGGSHLRFGLEMGGVKLNPFTIEPTAANLHFLTAFVRTLLETGNPPLSAAEEADLHRQIEALYAIDPSLRRLLSLSMILPKPLRERLAPWVEGGQYGAAFDSVEDTLALQHFQCIDLLDMDRYPAILEPLLFYILHRASALIYDPARQTGLKLVVMDEAWRFLRNQIIRRYVTEAVKTWRKHNAALLLATQSSDDLARSEIFPVLLESCPTKIFLANPGMDRTHYRETFHLNETEVAQIEQLIPKRQFLLKRPDLSTVLNLNVDPVGYWLYTNSPFDNERRKEALGAHGFREGLRVLAQEGNR